MAGWERNEGEEGREEKVREYTDNSSLDRKKKTKLSKARSKVFADVFMLRWSYLLNSTLAGRKTTVVKWFHLNTESTDLFHLSTITKMKQIESFSVAEVVFLHFGPCISRLLHNCETHFALLVETVLHSRGN